MKIISKKFNQNLQNDKNNEINISVTNPNINIGLLNDNLSPVSSSKTNFNFSGIQEKDNKIYIFVNLMRKYSEKFSSLLNEITSNNNNLKLNKELISTIEQFNKLLSNPKLNEYIFNCNSSDYLKKYENENLKNLIEKYESKINILISENEILKMNKENQTTLQNDLITKNNDLEKEKNELSSLICENNKKYDDILTEYNLLQKQIIELKNENTNISKENLNLKKQIQENKNLDLEKLQKELNYKNSIIKYLEDIINKNKNNPKFNLVPEETYRDEIEKMKNKNEQINNVTPPSPPSLSDISKKIESNINSNSQNQKSKLIKKEIDNLDEEIFELQEKLKEMLHK